jgi:hypothetical protein
MLINELSKKTGVSIHTIRFYENKGLIQGVTNESVKTNNTRIMMTAMWKKFCHKRGTGSRIYSFRDQILIDKWYSGTFPKEEQLKFFDNKIMRLILKSVSLNR